MSLLLNVEISHKYSALSEMLYCVLCATSCNLPFSVETGVVSSRRYVTAVSVTYMVANQHSVLAAHLWGQKVMTSFLV